MKDGQHGEGCSEPEPWDPLRGNDVTEESREAIHQAADQEKIAEREQDQQQQTAKGKCPGRADQQSRGSRMPQQVTRD
jgi:hypothetical protein